jgi:hypothetical protein
MAHEEEVLMDVSESSQPDGGLVLTCDSCDREIDPVAGGGVDDHGYALCAFYMGKQLGSDEGRADECRDWLASLLRGATSHMRGLWADRPGSLSRDETRALVEGVLGGRI